MLQTDLLENLTETKYLSAENYISYRAIMRLFYLEHQKMHCQMDRDSILSLLRGLPAFAEYPSERLAQDLDQLVKWKNLTSIQDPHKAYTIADFKNRQFQYLMTQPALEIERMTVTLENLSSRTAGLSVSSFRRIQADLRRAEQLEGLPLREVNAWWRDLQDDFRRLTQDHQDYLREFYGSGMEKQMKAIDFIAYKQHLVRYLEEFIQDLQHSAAQIGAQLDAFTEAQVSRLMELALQSELEIPRPPSEQPPGWQDGLARQFRGVWESLRSWFTGADSTAGQVLEITNEIIRSVVQNAALLVQMENMGVSNKAELRRLLSLFAGCDSLDEAHRLSALVFGAQQARHFSVNALRETDRIDLGTYDEAPMHYILQPRVRTYKARMDRSGFADRSEEKAEQRKQILADEQTLRQQVMGYIQNGRLDFAAIRGPVPPAVRTVFLSWIAIAGLSPDGHGYTQYGQSFTLQKRDAGPCQLLCTDGTLTLPDCVLIFEEERHV